MKMISLHADKPSQLKSRQATKCSKSDVNLHQLRPNMYTPGPTVKVSKTKPVTRGFWRRSRL